MKKTNDMKKNNAGSASSYREFMPNELETYKDEYEPYLRECLNFRGQYAELRKMGMKFFGAERIAPLSDRDLADEIQKYYVVVSPTDPNEGEEIVLVERSKIQEYNNLVTVLSR